MTKDPDKSKLKKLMENKDYDCTDVSKDYWDTIYKGVVDYLVKLDLIKIDDEKDATKVKKAKEDVITAISDYIRHKGSDGPQPMWGNP